MTDRKPAEVAAATFPHGLRRMTGRTVDGDHRPATSLELLFDLTFVAAFGVAGSELAHGIAVGHWFAAAGAFAFAMVAIVWAWINYAWFASAFDNDDWLFRAMTMVQMTGVIIVAIGIPPMFASIDQGTPLVNELLVAGYVVMRLAMVAQWLRAAKGDPRYRSAALSYALFISIAQIGWVLTALLPLDVWTTLLAATFLWIVELAGPILAEFKSIAHGRGGTPWHPHHIAERYGLVAIIALGETVLGTLAAAKAISDAEGWTIDTIVVVAAGIALTFALWWSYFLVPSGPILAVRRDRAFPWGYGHVVLFGSIAAVGAGVHVVGYVYDPHFEVSTLTAILSIAVPVLIFMVSLYLLHAWLVSTLPRNSVLQIATMVLPVLAVVLASAGAPLWACLLIVLTSPLAVILSYELGAWRTLSAQLENVLARASHRAADAGRDPR